MVTQQFTNIVDGLRSYNGGYCGANAGIHIGVYYGSSGYFSTADANKCIVKAPLITASKPIAYPTNMNISNKATDIWSIYGNELDVSDINYVMPTLSIIGAAAQYFVDPNANYQINITNPTPALPKQSDTVKIVSRNLGTLTNATNILFYNHSNGIYTDYTNSNNIPLDGDVGDILYIKCGVNSSTLQYALTFTMNSQSNDYEYVWEYFRNNTSAWYTMPSNVVLDNTNNFIKSGVVYLGTGYDFSNARVVNGISGSWFRIRITKKGTTNPTFSSVKFRNQYGIWLTKINEKYTCQLTVQDKSGNKLENAKVTITDVLGNSTILVTDSNGQTSLTDIITNTTAFDKDASEADYNYSTVTRSPFVIKIGQ
jgi:hypothetical protein